MTVRSMPQTLRGLGTGKMFRSIVAGLNAIFGVGTLLVSKSIGSKISLLAGLLLFVSALMLLFDEQVI